MTEHDRESDISAERRLNEFKIDIGTRTDDFGRIDY